MLFLYHDKAFFQGDKFFFGRGFNGDTEGHLCHQFPMVLHLFELFLLHRMEQAFLSYRTKFIFPKCNIFFSQQKSPPFHTDGLFINPSQNDLSFCPFDALRHLDHLPGRCHVGYRIVLIAIYLLRIGLMHLFLKVNKCVFCNLIWIYPF